MTVFYVIELRDGFWGITGQIDLRALIFVHL